ncbi:MAG: tRNA epoxyqueuosine(34) reductase QueG [Nitrospiraceae bacterium]|nr:tRNA epoxyqueuosine(34) reductase QueG [Nitrospiraceae bacterium]
MTPATRSLAIKEAAHRLGFDAVGISIVTQPDSASEESGQVSDRYGRLTEWLRRGYQAGMTWMAKDPAKRADPNIVLPGCRSVVSVGLNYYSHHRADERPGHGRIARYAWGEDYHRILGERLTALGKDVQAICAEARSLTYVDTGPVMEKTWAQQAGLGWIGKHSNLVSARHGSWLLLGEILTTAELQPDEPGSDLCGTCRLCIQACPTGAIPEPYIVDARRCISYLTIEYRGDGSDVPEEVRRAIGNRIFGCDDCLDACPYNHAAEPSKEQRFQPTALTLAPDLSRLAKMEETEFSATFRLSPIKRAKASGLHRNIVWAQASTAPPRTAAPPRSE